MASIPFQSNQTETISICLSPEAKECIESAAKIDLRSISSFMIESSLESANRILQRSDQMVLSNRDWDRFYHALLHPPEPTPALKQAVSDYQSMNIHSDV